MAGETVITVVGNLTADPELRFTPSGAAVANFTVASTPRTFDRQSGEWKDGDALFMRCNVWRQAAENVAETLTRGMRVMVSGRLRQRSFETREGEKRTVVELEVDEVGPSLRYATAKVNKVSRGSGGGGYGGGSGGGGHVDDPWGSAPPAGSAPEVGDDRDLQLGGDLRVQAHRDRVLAHGLDLAGHVDRPSIQQRAAGRAHGVDHVGRGDRTEQAAGVTGRLGRHGDVELAQLGGDLLGVAEVADLAGLAGPGDRGDLLLGPAGGHHGHLARQQVVAAVTVLDLDDVPRCAQVGHVGGEDELHFGLLLALSGRSRCRAAARPRGSS
jgi:single-strand DNA-binding protein